MAKRYKHILGAIVGDVIGSSYEGWSAEDLSDNGCKGPLDFDLFTPRTRFTDDTVMTLAVARWIMEDPEHHHHTLVSIMQEMGRRYPNAGYGHAFRMWLKSNNPQPYNSWGNGSAMRVSPVAICAKTLDEVLRLAKIQAEVTHNHAEGIKGAQAVAAAIWLTMRHFQGSYIRYYIGKTFGYSLRRTAAEIRRCYRFDSSCQGSVPEAICVATEPGYVNDVVRKAISIGGDTDTIAAMAASIARMNDIDYNFGLGMHGDEDKAFDYLDDYLLNISDRFDDFAEPIIEAMQEKSISERDAFRGCLIGGAVGDALGYPVEFMKYGEIRHRYHGDITHYSLSMNGKALVSDDTQMTLFTACGILAGWTAKGHYPLEQLIHLAYDYWLKTQTQKEVISEPYPFTWISKLPALYARRAPGITCLNALQDPEWKNDSKGCGGIMRVAPVALYYADRALNANEDEQRDFEKDVFGYGCSLARITHHHPLGYLSAGALCVLLYNLAIERDNTIDYKCFKYHVWHLKEWLKTDTIYHSEREEKAKARLVDIISRVEEQAECEATDEENLIVLGEGWVAEETLAIALYCCLRYLPRFEDAIRVAVNHSGDSDSTGSVTGQIMGLIHGIDGIPPHFKKNLELYDLVELIADDLTVTGRVMNDDQWEEQVPHDWLKRYTLGKMDGYVQANAT